MWPDEAGEDPVTFKLNLLCQSPFDGPETCFRARHLGDLAAGAHIRPES